MKIKIKVIFYLASLFSLIVSYHCFVNLMISLILRKNFIGFLFQVTSQCILHYEFPGCKVIFHPTSYIFIFYYGCSLSIEGACMMHCVLSLAFVPIMFKKKNYQSFYLAYIRRSRVSFSSQKMRIPCSEVSDPKSVLTPNTNVYRYGWGSGPNRIRVSSIRFPSNYTQIILGIDGVIQNFRNTMVDREVSTLRVTFRYIPFVFYNGNARCAIY